MQDLSTLELMRLTSPPQACSYLPEQTASLEYRIIFAIDPAAYEDLLQRGWRRHGCHFFRPACPACTECRSLRVDVARFRPTKSQRRCLARNTHVRVEIGEPAVSGSHLRLFNTYHADMHERRGWPHKRVTPEEYVESFLVGTWSFAREFRYFDGSRLVGVGLVDEVASGLSSVYFYHEPAWRPLGPGTFSILSEIEHARDTGRPWHYLGYWIAGCASMSYKARFGPHELLLCDPPDGEQPLWQPDSPAR
ncbi:MAG TPA: arginyltransferase [Planctomycetaceae bacterium]|nr:arginyltransferase [Planctomycetaceae bacterium]